MKYSRLGYIPFIAETSPTSYKRIDDVMRTGTVDIHN